MPRRSSRATVDGQGGRRFAPITGIDLTCMERYVLDPALSEILIICFDQL